MEIKTRHTKYKDFQTRKQLLQKGLVPTTEGVELWINSYCKISAIYFDKTKAKKLTAVYIYKDYLIDEKAGYITTEISVIDQTGNIVFDQLIRPRDEWLKVTKNSAILGKISNTDKWVNQAKNKGWNYKDILFADPYEKVAKNLVKTINKLPYVNTIISYNVDSNVPYQLENDDKYKKIDLMELFAEVVKEPLPQSDFYENTDGQKYKWQKLNKCLNYYGIKADSSRPADVANAIRLAYEKYLASDN